MSSMGRNLKFKTDPPPPTEVGMPTWMRDRLSRFERGKLAAVARRQ